MTESSINILIPYSREYVSNTYKISDPDILYIIEKKLILNLISRLSEGLDIKKIAVLSNDLEHLKGMQSNKVFIRPRSTSTLNISSRSDLEDLGRIEFPAQNFLMVNALFPLMTLNTLRNLNSFILRENTNVFLGTKGKSRSSDQGVVSLACEDTIWDFGAVTGVCGHSSIHQWSVFSEYTTIELLNVRKAEDIQQIISILSLGLI
tara:strand:- start:3303 stop:3920 length:618 start_codon:yes stop_codon:yes gene_type:complete